MQDEITTQNTLTAEEKAEFQRMKEATWCDPRYIRTEALDAYLSEIKADEHVLYVLQSAFQKLEIHRANFRVWLHHVRNHLPGVPKTPLPERNKNESEGTKKQIARELSLGSSDGHESSMPMAHDLVAKQKLLEEDNALKRAASVMLQTSKVEEAVWHKFAKPQEKRHEVAAQELTDEDQAQLVRLVKVLRIKNYAAKTIAAYSGAVRRLMQYARSLGKSLVDLTDDEFLEYAVSLQQRGNSHETLRILRSALLFYWGVVLGLRRELPLLSNIRRAKKLPVVLNHDEILRILQAISNVKHRLMVSLMYSSGLRVSEVVKLRVRDIDPSDMQLTVRAGKGKKDRVSILSVAQQELLAKILKNKAGHEFVFTSAYAPKKPLSVRSLQHVFARAMMKAGIKKRATCHSLRHSFATHLLESGTDLRWIQKLLGHENVTTTTIYTRVATRSVKAVASPLKGM